MGKSPEATKQKATSFEWKLQRCSAGKKLSDEGDGIGESLENGGEMVRSRSHVLGPQFCGVAKRPTKHSNGEET